MLELAKSRAIGMPKADWLPAISILLIAGSLRIAFFSGGLGTDEIVYMTQAQRLLTGDPGHAGYIGAIRGGINGFQALSFYLFGTGTVGAAGLFFLCSLGQVLLVYWFANRLWGRRAAIWAGIALAVLPIDVTLAGGLNPDPYLGLVITASIVVFYCAEEQDSAALYFFAGGLAGWVFWIKDEVIVFGLLFVILAVSERRWRTRWLWFLLGGFLCWLSDLIFFWATYGDPIYHYRVVGQTVHDQIAGQVLGQTSPWTYVSLLLIKIYHTGLLGWLAVAGGVFALRRRFEPGIRFVLIWGFGLIVIFSALPVSFSPVDFIRKQSNYMEIFAAPLALLAGWFLSQQRRVVAFVLGGAMMVSGMMLSGLEQEVIRVVTVNGRAAAAFAQAHADVPVFGPLTAQRRSTVERLLKGSLDDATDIRPISGLSRLSLSGGAANDRIAFVVEDPQMRNWQGSENERQGSADPEYRLPQRLRGCLLPAGQLEPGDLGLGQWVVAALHSVGSLVPEPLGDAVTRATYPLWQVLPAKVYAVTRECAREARL